MWACFSNTAGALLYTTKTTTNPVLHLGIKIMGIKNIITKGLGMLFVIATLQARDAGYPLPIIGAFAGLSVMLITMDTEIK